MGRRTKTRMARRRKKRKKRSSKKEVELKQEEEKHFPVFRCRLTLLLPSFSSID